MSNKFQFDVFLSHNSKDKPQVRKLAERLDQAGLRVWLDEWVIQPGDIISLKVDEGLEESRVLLLCLSPAALASDWVALERSTAIHRDAANAGRRFIPLLLADCELPDTIRRYKFVDFREEAERAFAELLQACKADGLENHGLRIDREEELGTESQKLSKPIVSLTPETLRTLCATITSDFTNSVLASREVNQSAFEEVKNDLVDAQLIPTNLWDTRFPRTPALSFFPETDDLKQMGSKRFSWFVHSDSWHGNIRDAVFTSLSAIGPLRIGCTIHNPSVQATIAVLQKGGASVAVDCNAYDGIHIVDRVESDFPDWDFLFCADANIFQRGELGVSEYRYLFPVLLDRHVFFELRKSYSGLARELIVARHTSGEQQLKLGIGVTRFSDVTFVGRDDLVPVLENLSAGQTLLAWEPLGFGVRDELRKYPARGFRFSFSVYCHRRYWQPGQSPSPVVGTFAEAFIGAWNYLRKQPALASAIICSEKTVTAVWPKFLGNPDGTRLFEKLKARR